ncbi:MAG: single-stranded DNA-binding protein [Nitrospirae bacterium GWC2_46_6]|nr:MAG: single-stranded DNA-binding protein [Nitrospirae bacterium GWC2_46_6]OGW20247.1 MAG: single-stranded DNA-binding protein [Nitrospirae bacterium GWA2_46_11]OGW23124.1 MAG: single-stranded DNA-binding protein [Nitrospirae bacterium GWB2_47_37]
MSFNKVIIMGNLTKDPDLRYIPTSSAPVARFTVAVNSKYKQNGEMKEDVLFMDTVVFGKQAENCGQYLSKGRPVLVEGKLKEKSWEHEGQKHRKIEILASNVRFLTKKESTGEPELSDLEVPDEPKESF